jgi:hypothetical protein
MQLDCGTFHLVRSLYEKNIKRFINHLVSAIIGMSFKEGVSKEGVHANFKD